MAEYIEREALIQKIDEGFHKTAPDGEEQIGFLQCRRIARELPAADVVPVVRCVECQYAWHCPNGYIYCQRDGRNAYEMVFKKDDFCSYGERKEG